MFVLQLFPSIPRHGVVQIPNLAGPPRASKAGTQSGATVFGQSAFVWHTTASIEPWMPNGLGLQVSQIEPEPYVQQGVPVQSSGPSQV
jgi:hypothetical protein